MRFYFDTCCLLRSFDDASQARVRIEAQAILSLLADVVAGRHVLVSSEALLLEVAANPDPDHRAAVMALLHGAELRVPYDDAVRQRATTLASLGFDAFDAAHIASAELGKADWFLSVDDRLLRKAARRASSLGVKVCSPLTILSATP